MLVHRLEEESLSNGSPTLSEISGMCIIVNVHVHVATWCHTYMYVYAVCYSSTLWVKILRCLLSLGFTSCF